MRVTLKTVNTELARQAPDVELVKGSGYFFFRGGESENWIDRTVHVPAIGALSLEQWIGEYTRLRSLHEQLMTSAKSAPAQAAKKPAKPPAPAPKEPCRLKAELLAELEQVHAGLAAIEEQEMRAARESRFSELAALSASSSANRAKFDHALLAFREHAKAHNC